MKDQLINIQTATLARTCGFTIPCVYAFADPPVEGEVVYLPYYPENRASGLWKGSLSFLQCPTQSLLQKWLREKHQVDITLMISGADSYRVYVHKNRNCLADMPIEVHPTPEIFKIPLYEQALERGLQFALTFLVK